MRLFIFRYDVYTNPFCLFCKVADEKSPLLPLFQRGKLVSPPFNGVRTVPPFEKGGEGGFGSGFSSKYILMQSAKVTVA